MVRYILKTLGMLLISLISITFLTFCLIQLAPDDAASIMLRGSGILPSVEAVQALREQLGINQWWPIQYLSWIGNLLHGDLGTSFSNGLPVTDTLTPSAIKTLELAFKAFILTIVVSIPLGVFCAKYQNRFGDYLVRVLTYVYSSIPTFVVGIVALYIFGVKLKLVPTIANNHEGGLTLPIIVLASTSIAWMVRQVRTIFMEKMNDSYVDGLKARGVCQWRIDIFYILKNSMVPIVTSLGVCFGSMLGGAVVVEKIFTWSGLGQSVLQAINSLDYPILLGFALYIAIIYFVINFAIDLLYGVFDPRMRAEGKILDNRRKQRAALKRRAKSTMADDLEPAEV
jgi:peptide/nickel transport system permease protein